MRGRRQGRKPEQRGLQGTGDRDRKQSRRDCREQETGTGDRADRTAANERQGQDRDNRHTRRKLINAVELA